MSVSFLVVAVTVALLEPCRLVKQTIAGGQTATFRLVVAPQAFTHGVVDQGDVDLTVDVFEPTGARMARFDQRERGAEFVSFIAPMGGTYRVEVRTVAPTERRTAYTVWFDRPRSPGMDDDGLIRAEALTTDAKGLLKKGDRESVQQAAVLFGQALPLWRAAGQRGAELSTLVGVGDANYALSEYADADRIYREALALSRDVAVADRRTEAEVLNNLAMIAWPRGEIPEALSLLQQALDQWRALKFAFGEATALSNRGILLRQSGEYDQARQHYARALTLFRSLHDRRGEAFALNNIAIVLESLGERREALDNLRRAVRLFREVGDAKAAGRALLAQARIQLALGDRAASLVAVQLAMPPIHASGDRLAESDAVEHLGRVRDASGDRVQARAEFDSALVRYRAIGSRRGASDSLHDMGVSHLRGGDAATALPFLLQALELRRSIGMPGLEADTLFRIAQAERAAGDLDRARADLEAALDRAEQLRAGVFERELRAAYFSSSQSYYSEYIDLLVQLERSRPDAGFGALAFEAVERARARGVLELLAESRASLPASGNQALLARERELRRAITNRSWQLWQQANRPAVATDEPLTSNIDALLREYRDIEAEIRRTDPRSSTVQTAKPASVETVQRDLLDDRTALLEYALGDERSYLWIVTTGAINVVELPGRGTIERHARRYSALVRVAHSGDTAPGATAARDAEASALARILLAPAGRALLDRLIVVPDGALHDVPFAALPDPLHRGALVVRHEVVTLPSATTLVVLRRELASRRPAPKLVAVLADPVFDPTDSRVRSPRALRSHAVVPDARPLTRLPFSRDEADRILALAPERQRLKATDFDASRELAASAEMSQYQFVHFATHAFRDDRRPMLSGIVLSLVGPGGEERNGFLRLPDVFALRLHAELVVLSACETGSGGQAHGEGLSGLTLAFFYAGAARVLSTLWKVDDEATAEMMALFYKELLSGRNTSPAAALRSAQNALQQQRRWRDPYYWSGFVLYGGW